MTSHAIFLPALLMGCAFAAFGQNAAPPADPPAGDPPAIQPGQTQTNPPPPDKRIFGVLPNYRTANETAVYTPITTKQKLTIAAKDSFDYPLVGLGAC